MEEYKFKVNFGDWSGDGHEKMMTVVFSSNVALEEIQKAYKHSEECSGYSLDNRNTAQLSDYEKNTISSDILKKMLPKSHNSPDFENEFEDNDNHLFHPENIADLFMAFIMDHNPEIVLKEINDDLLLFKQDGFIAYGIF